MIKDKLRSKYWKLQLLQ